MNDLTIKEIQYKARLEVLFGLPSNPDYLHGARAVQSRRYKAGQIVHNTDSKYKYGKKFIFVSSVRWCLFRDRPGWGGYLVIHAEGRCKGKFTTTTGIHNAKRFKESQQRRKADYIERARHMERAEMYVRIENDNIADAARNITTYQKLLNLQVTINQIVKTASDIGCGIPVDSSIEDILNEI